MPPDPPHLRAVAEEADLAEYRALSGLAVAALCFGALSAAAFLTPVLWLLPPLGAALSGLALWRIARNAPALTGRWLALAGLALAVLFAAAAPTDWLLYNPLLRREARQFAQRWFDALAEGQPQKAHQLHLHPRDRSRSDDDGWEFYRRNLRWRKDLVKLTDQPLVRTLLDKGPKARARFYATGQQEQEPERLWLQLIYAVTYDEDRAQQSFFVSMWLHRVALDNGKSAWIVYRADGGFRPEGW
jgi:hypothetical protein